MSLGIRKVAVLALVAGVFLLANLWFVTNWLQERGVVDVARHVRSEYITGTAITIIIVLLILLVGQGGHRGGLIRRCSVCDHTLFGTANYCGACGSKA